MDHIKLDDDFAGSGTTGLVGFLNQQDRQTQMKIVIMIQDAWRWLKRLPPGPSRAQVVYREVDNVVEENFKSESPEVSCRKGCAHCCYHEVMISDDEARLLAQIAKDTLSVSEIHKLKKQSSWEEGVDGWEAHTKSEKRCVFLDLKTARCRIYKDRPASCRKYFVLTPAELCAVENGDNITMTVNMAEILVSAAFNLPGSAGSLPKMVAKYL